jgi:uncharacterized protein YndB with AHSA1/START domain
MKQLASLEAFGAMSEPLTLKIQRSLPGPMERVWSYLTQSELRRQWLAAGEMTLEEGAAFEFVWRNDELSDAPAARPGGIPEEERMRSRITELDVPRRISFTWEESGDVTFELEERGDEVLLTVTHRRLPDRDTALQVSAGWHAHLDILVIRMGGGEPGPFWAGWSRLRDEYDRRLPA